MKITTALAIGLSLTGGLALTALAGSDEDARYAEYLRGAGKDQSLYILPSSMAAPSSVPSSPPPGSERPRANVDTMVKEEFTLARSAVSSTDEIEKFSSPHGRFSKVPKYLVPFYEKAARDYQIPVKYLVADGSWESHFNAKTLSDGGRSCGIHQFHANSRRVPWPQNWGFRDLAHCQEPEANIRKAAELWRKLMDGVCNGVISCAIRRHNGVNSYGYMRNVMSGAERYYSHGQ